jgi:triacylglycerol lipase
VLVNGTFEPMIKNWMTLSPALKDAGYCVYGFNYGYTNGVPQTAAMEGSAEELSRFVNSVLGASGAKKVNLVGHSQGGLMPLYYLKYLGGATKVNALVGIAPATHGSDTFGLSGYSDPAVENPLCPACSQAGAGSSFLQKVAAGGDTLPGVFYTTIATKYDAVATPYTSQALVGPEKQVTNVVLQDFCPLDVVEHDQAPNDPVVRQLVLAALSVTKGPLSPSFRPDCL